MAKTALGIIATLAVIGVGVLLFRRPTSQTITDKFGNRFELLTQNYDGAFLVKVNGNPSIGLLDITLITPEDNTPTATGLVYGVKGDGHAYLFNGTKWLQLESPLTLN